MSFDQTSIRYFFKEHGKVVTLRKLDSDSYDKDTGTIGYTHTDYYVNGYSMNNSPFELTDSSIVVSTRRVILSAKQTNGQDLPQPEVNDQVIVDGLTFDILKVYDSKSHESMICYTLVCKG